MSGNVRIKICGVTDPEDALAAVNAGADLIGVNFVQGSHRCVDIHIAESICEAVAGMSVERVALFRDATWDEIEHVLRRAEFDRVQFHGDETEEEVESVDLPVIKAIRGADVSAAETYPGTLLLLDHPSEGGGKGKVWDWSEASEIISLGYDVILAGGLTPDNVGQALRDIGGFMPWGVDVATGVEVDGRKDPALIEAFIAAVRAAEEEDQVEDLPSDQ
ncbi:MAG: phosphoribosylanthranilate isomerase [Myxococcales bacterium]|nr:phosphoribosylanthranilate isomerase [Myxococcales bacterium]MCH7869625.1 phosphoribosylanthranilate isomerase [Myxococcales bacterium]